MSLILDADGNQAKVPFLLNEAEGNVIRMAFGMNEAGELPKKPRNHFLGGKVPRGSEKEKILNGMAAKGLIQLIGVAGSKLNDKERLELRAALDSAEGQVPVEPERVEAFVLPWGLVCFKHTLQHQEAERARQASDKPKGPDPDLVTLLAECSCGHQQPVSFHLDAPAGSRIPTQTCDACDRAFDLTVPRSTLIRE